MDIKRLLEDIVYFLLILVVGTIPFFVLINSYLIISLLLASTIYFIRYRKTYKINTSISYYFPTAIFLVALLGLIYTNNLKSGFYFIEKNLSALVFPIIFLLIPFVKTKTQNLLKFFAISVFSLMTFYLIFQLRLIYNSSQGLETLFHYNTHYNIARRFGSHNTYLSAYIIFSIIIFLYTIFSKKEKKNYFPIVFYVFLILLFILYVIIMASRSQFIGLTLILITSIIVYIYVKRKLVIGVISIVFCIISILYVVENVHFLSYRFDNIINDEFKMEKQDRKGEKRFYRWESIYQNIDKSSVFGYGTGDEQQTINSFYEKDDLDIAIDKYNAHNEYLSTYVRWGWFGLVLVFSFFVYQFYLAIKSKDFLYFNFVLIISHLALYESILSVQKGIVFTFFFASLFLLKHNSKAVD